MTTCQCGSVSCHKCSSLGVLVMGRLFTCGAGGTWELSAPSSSFCCEPRAALKKKSINILKG